MISQSQLWGSMPSGTCRASCDAGATDDEGGSSPGRLVNYEGEVTAVHSNTILELDHRWQLLLTHVPPRHRVGIRPGCRVLLSDVHPLCVRTHTADSARAGSPGDADGRAARGEGGSSVHSGCNGWDVFGFGMCMRSGMQLIRHADLPQVAATGAGEASVSACAAKPEREVQACAEQRSALSGSPRPLFPTTSPRVMDEVTRMARQRLTLAELAEYLSQLQRGGDSWQSRWQGLMRNQVRDGLRRAEVQRALETLLQHFGIEGLGRQGMRRCYYDEFLAHSAGVQRRGDGAA